MMQSIRLKKGEMQRFSANLTVRVLNAGRGSCQITVDRPIGTQIHEQKRFRNNVAVPHDSSEVIFDFQKGTAFFFGSSNRLRCTEVDDDSVVFVFENVNVEQFMAKD